MRTEKSYFICDLCGNTMSVAAARIYRERDGNFAVQVWNQYDPVDICPGCVNRPIRELVR